MIKNTTELDAEHLESCILIYKGIINIIEENTTSYNNQMKLNIGSVAFTISILKFLNHFGFNSKRDISFFFGNMEASVLATLSAMQDQGK